MKISPMENEFDPTEFGQIKYYVYFYRLPDDEIIDAKLYVATEKNAYGVVFEKWYDGSVLRSFRPKKQIFLLFGHLRH